MLVTGRVSDFDNLPIPGVIVTDNLGNGTQTDANGMYYFESELGATITAYYFDNEASDVFDDDGNINFTISTDFQTGEVEIVADRVAKKRKFLSDLDMKLLPERIVIFAFILLLMWLIKRYWL